MRSHKILEHTADVRLKVEGDNMAELFTAAVEGMAGIISSQACLSSGTGPQTFRPDREEEVSVSSPDIKSLLIDFLSEVLTQSHINRTVYCAAEIHELTENSVQATVFGRNVEQFEEDIKAVTYHEVNVVKNEAGNYEAIIIFDI